MNVLTDGITAAEAIGALEDRYRVLQEVFMTRIRNEQLAKEARADVELELASLDKAIDALNQGTMRLAELMMDTAVSSALKGKTMDETDLGEGPTAPHPMVKAEFE